jgi:hypothetical protein
MRYGIDKYKEIGLEYSMHDIPAPGQDHMNTVAGWMEEEGIISL